MNFPVAIAQFPESAGDPAAVANSGKLYTKDVAGVTQLFFQADNGTVYRISNILPGEVPVNVTKAAAAAGTSTNAARADHKHDIATATPVSIGIANAEGTATSVARSDHVHSGPVSIIFAGGASMGAGDVGKHFGAQEGSNGGKAAALSSDNQMASGITGTMRRLTWSTAAADATTVFKVNKNGVVVETIVLSGMDGSAALTASVAAGDLIAVEYDSGTAPGRTVTQVYAN